MITSGMISNRSIPLPSQSTLCRLRGRIDVAYMLVTRILIKTCLEGRGLVMYPVVDSSPQGGRDYELMVLYITRRAVLARLHHRIQDLESRWYCFVPDVIVDVSLFS